MATAAEGAPPNREILLELRQAAALDRQMRRKCARRSAVLMRKRASTTSACAATAATISARAPEGREPNRL